MDCLATFLSGNYAYNICRILEKKGYVFEVVSTPCQIAKGGCGYSLKFPITYLDFVVAECRTNRIPFHEIYKAIPMFSKFKYEKIY